MKGCSEVDAVIAIIMYDTVFQFSVDEVLLVSYCHAALLAIKLDI